MDIQRPLSQNIDVFGLDNDASGTAFDVLDPDSRDTDDNEGSDDDMLDEDKDENEDELDKKGYNLDDASVDVDNDAPNFDGLGYPNQFPRVTNDDMSGLAPPGPTLSWSNPPRAITNHERVMYEMEKQDYMVNNGDRLAVISGNLHNGMPRYHGLIRKLHHLDKIGERVHVVGLQEIPATLLDNPRGSGKYALKCEPLKPDPQNPDQALPRRYVAFLVHRSLAEESLHFQWVEECARGLCATLKIDLLDDVISLHNVYNRAHKINFPSLFTAVETGSDLWFGDFNVWLRGNGGSSYSKAHTEDVVLNQIILDSKLHILNDLSKDTYSHGSRYAPDSAKTCIDYFIASQSIVKLRWNIINCPAFDYDHRLTMVIVKAQPDYLRDLNSRWPKDPKKLEEIKDALICKFEGYKLPKIKGTDDIDTEKATDEITAMLQEVMDATVPKEASEPSSDFCENTPNMQRLHDKQNEIRRRLPLSAEEEIPELLEQDEAAEKAMTALERKKHREEHEAKLKERYNGRKGGNRAFKDAKRKNQGPQAQKMCDLKGPDDTIYTTSEEKVRLLRDVLFSEASDEPNFNVAEFIKEWARETKFTALKLLDGKLRKMIKALPFGKAPGDDGIPYELIRHGIDILLPYLESLFNACLTQQVFPASFKLARTMLLRKPKDKKPHDSNPKSYRPIALLSCIGKILEKIIAQLLMDECEEKRMLHFLQFGVRGTDTTKAVQCVVNQVHRGWSMNLKTSILGFDIQGAYNDVDRVLLLRRLIQKRVSNYLIVLIASFLSDRRVVIDLKGHEKTEAFWVHM